MTESVTRSDQEGVAVLSLSHPPMNGLSQGVVMQLHGQVAAALSDASVRAVVVTGAGGTFASGADLRQTVVRPDPALTALCALLEDARKPTVAAIQGQAIGPGLELALACHARVAHEDARFAMPDIALGWLPAAGGVQRLTRIVGGQAALRILSTGRAFGVKHADQRGLLDRVVSGGLVEAACAHARAIAPRPTRKRLDALIHAKADLAALDEARRLPAKTQASGAILECIAAALTDDMATGFHLEARLAAACAQAPEARALRAVFLARRDAMRPSGSGADRVALRRVGVLSRSVEATVLAAHCARAGLDVTLLDGPTRDLDAQRAQIASRLEAAQKAGQISATRKEAIIASMACVEGLATVEECDVVMADTVRDDVLTQLHAQAAMIVAEPPKGQAGPQVLPVSGLMAPRSVIETRPNEHTAASARALGLMLARRLDRPVIELPAGQGSVLGALEAAWLLAADHLLSHGVETSQVDAAFAKAGWREGPFLRQDRLSLPVIEERLKSAPEPYGCFSPIRRNLIALGHRGAKAGHGFYMWDESGPVDENPAVEAEVAVLAAGPELSLNDAEIVTYCADAITNCAIRLLGSGGVVRASDLDVVAVFGLGWPRAQGGPIWAAQDQGLGQFLTRLWGYSAKDGAFWSPAPLLENAVFEMRETLLP